MNHNELIAQTIAFVKKTLKDAEGGHDWFHIERVYKTSLHLAAHEDVDLTVVSLGALLHDIADAKFHDGDETIGPKKASEFLASLNVKASYIDQVVYIIENISFKSNLDKELGIFSETHPLALQVIQDADRLDAIGAIGIARAFNYGGYKNRALYNPKIVPNLNMDKATYKKSTAPTINHFYEKLLLLKDKMNTTTGRKLAEKRHQFMLLYLDQFYAEWEGEI